ncbi:glycosyltransferase family 4 protein [Pseudoalteromonas distincta]|uniref:Glycosyltransferase family 4 protein n=1 Tax=Pseudoalteromonas distincta TaxID=77608 RepID=A0A4P9IY53_9GAMM|nr:glycosyltransferase family 1 protein [Pseudoalteromonas distincta]QCU73139.1 glycosyltransferase family 4 protein [Pseudoalteromonas distincta]
MKIIDYRWSANHGIGRFSSEILKNMRGNELQGDFSDIFNTLDPVRLYLRCVIGRAWYISPSYNCPLFWAKRSIITLHDLMHIKFSDYSGLKNKIYYKLLVKLVCKKSPLVFTVSEFTKQEIVTWAGISADKIVVVYNGVDDKYHTDVAPYIMGEPYVFYIGDKKPHKNIRRLIESFSLSKSSNTHTLLLSGVENPEIKNWASEFGVQDKVKFSGFIPEERLPSYYKGAALLALPSLYEGFGLPIIEAMAVGTPVLTSNLTSMPEIAGDAAVLINPLDVDDIARGIDLLISEGVKKFSRRYVNSTHKLIFTPMFMMNQRLKIAL